MRLISEDRRRMVDDAPALAIAAYAISDVGNGRYEGCHIGIFENRDDAEAWVKEGKPEPIRIRVT